MSAMLVALVLKSTNNIFLALIVALIFGVAVGVINGLLVTRLGLPAFLATLGMMQVIRGAAMWITNTEAVPISNTVFNTIFGTGFVGPISVLILWTILFYILGYILFNRTPKEYLPDCIRPAYRTPAKAESAPDNIKTYILILCTFIPEY